MNKIILTIALFLGFFIASNAQTSATGDIPAKKKPVTETSSPIPSTVTNTNTTESKPVENTTTNNSTKNKSTKKACCKTKSDACCKKKTEAIKED